MKNASLKLTALGVAAALGLAACNSGSDSTSGISKTNYVTSGVITALGSVYVNGVHFETDTTEVEMDGVAGLDESKLKVGMYITLTGDVNADGSTGRAASIKYSDDVEGMVLVNNVAVDGTLNVMGQVVTVTADTEFESAVTGQLSPADIALNNIVEVSGYSNGGGSIFATRIEVKSDQHVAGEEVEVKGLVSALDATAQTFTIGNMTVDYSGAMLEDFGTVALADGQFVEVKSTDGVLNSVLVASKVELENGGEKFESRNDGEEMEIEGMVTATLVDGVLEINGQKVLLGNDVEFEHGDLTELVLQARIEVEGKYDAEGNFVADEIKFREEGDTEMSGYVEVVDVANNTLVMFGQTIALNNLTKMEDERDESGMQPVRYFSLQNIAQGDWVELKAYQDDNGNWIATQMKRDDDEFAGVTPEVELEGSISAIDPTTGHWIVGGVEVDPASANSVDFTVDMEVELKGTYAGGIFTVTSVSMDG